MAAIRVLSAGAAQAVVEKIAESYTRDAGREVDGEFSAVGAIKQRVLEGAAADVIILTGALIDELISAGNVIVGSRADIGKVGTGVAVRADTPLPDVSSAQLLRDALLGASKVVCPDPATATAGKVVMQVLESLGVKDRMMPNMRYFPNGYAAMKWLADSGGQGALGITQITEILANKRVTYAGPLPGNLQTKTIYSAGLSATAAEPDAAREFISRLTSPAARRVLVSAGYEFDD